MKRRIVIITLIISMVLLLIGSTVPVLANDGIEVTIDIKPDKDPDVLNVNVIGWLPVAIYYDEEKGVTSDTIDCDSIYLEGVYRYECRDDKSDDYLLAKFDAKKVIANIEEIGDVDLTLTGN